jgi:cytochrome P450
VQAVCGDEDPMAEDLSHMPLIDAVVSECLRLYPPAPILSKDVIVDHVLTADVPGKAELKLKAGHHVHVDLHVINQLPELWGPTAEQFDHTRWMQKTKPYSHPFAYLPFSSGTRNCQ